MVLFTLYQILNYHRCITFHDWVLDYLCLQLFRNSQTKCTMSNFNDSLKTYPKTFSHIGLMVPDIEHAV